VPKALEGPLMALFSPVGGKGRLLPMTSHGRDKLGEAATAMVMGTAKATAMALATATARATAMRPTHLGGRVSTVEAVEAPAQMPAHDGV
jgi:hypothetical protein